MCRDATGDAIVFFTPTGKALAAAAPMSAVTERRTASAPSTRETTTRNDDIETRRPDRPRTHRSPTPLERLTRALAERGVDPDWRTNLPTHRYEHDIPWAVEAAAREALEAAWDGAHGNDEEDAA